jgi:hypothetical protein
MLQGSELMLAPDVSIPYAGAVERIHTAPEIKEPCTGAGDPNSGRIRG